MSDWVELSDFPGYCVNRDGQVRGKLKEFLKLRMNKDGYVRVALSLNNILYCRFVHRLVAQTFLPNPNNLPEVDHIDRNRSNNNISNLRWVSKIDNCSNRGMQKNNQSGITGIYLNQKKQLWVCKKSIKGKKYIKRFKQRSDAEAFLISLLKENE